MDMNEGYEWDFFILKENESSLFSVKVSWKFFLPFFHILLPYFTQQLIISLEAAVLRLSVRICDAAQLMLIDLLYERSLRNGTFHSKCTRTWCDHQDARERPGAIVILPQLPVEKQG